MSCSPNSPESNIIKVGRIMLEMNVGCGPETMTKNTRRSEMALFTPSDSKQPNQNGRC